MNSWTSITFEIKKDDVTYGTSLMVNMDTNTVHFIRKIGNIFKYQEYKTRNKNKRLRRIKIGRNTELFQSLKEEFIKKYNVTKIKGVA